MTQPLTSLDAIVHDMTGDERIENVLRRYCQSIRERWERHVDEDDDFLSHFVPPSFSQKVRDGKLLDSAEVEVMRRSGENLDHLAAYELVSDPAANEDQQLYDLFSLGLKIIVTEDAGAGKSIFTRRAHAWFATPATWKLFFDGEPCLPYRWERTEANAWPESDDGYLAQLEDAVRPFCKSNDDTVTPTKVVQYALKNQRVVLFCDAFDQNNNHQQKEAFERFVRTTFDQLQYKGNRLVVTSRAYAYEEASSVFPNGQWIHCRLEPFSPTQQVAYLRDLIEQAGVDTSGVFEDGLTPEQRDERAVEVLKAPQIFGDVYDDVKELLKVPVVLAFVRELAKANDQFPRFNNRADLYFQVTDRLLDRNLEKKDSELAASIRRYKRELREVLSAVAYEMMLQDARNYVLQSETDVEDLGDKARSRITTKSVLDNWDDDRQTGQPGLWSLVEHVAGFTSHLMVERKSDGYFGWKHRGMMEFYCGLYLARNSNPNWYSESDKVVYRDENNKRQRETLFERSATGDWEWPFRFAVELLDASSRDARNQPVEETLVTSMCVLFSPKQTYARPTELMHRAWCLMSRSDEFDGLDAVLDSYRSDFHSTLASDNLQDAQLAASLLIDADVEQLASSEKIAGRSFDDLRPSERCYPGYGWCSDRVKGDKSADDDWLHFLIGDPNNEGEFADWQRRDIAAFWMSSTCVSREQYRLFDAVREQSDGDSKNVYASLSDCPITHVSWHDSFCFGLWLGDGYALPREEQWEGACWGGVERAVNTDYVLGIEPYHRGFTTSDVNYDGNYPLSEKDEDKSHYLERTLPVVWDESRHAVAGLSATEWERGCCKHAAYRSNAFGLWHMHGNVDEWCQTAWLESLEESLVAPHGEADSNVQSRVLRGGSWYFYAGGTVASNRNWNWVGYRYNYIGFRLTRTR